MHDWIVEATGQKPTIFRFAGGSVNDYNQENCRAIIEEMTRRGYTYFDWNVDSGDSTLGQGGEAIRETTVEGILQRDKSVGTAAQFFHQGRNGRTGGRKSSLRASRKATGSTCWIPVSSPSHSPFRNKMDPCKPSQKPSKGMAFLFSIGKGNLLPGDGADLR